MIVARSGPDFEPAAPVGGEAVRGACAPRRERAAASRKRAARRPRSNASATASVAVRRSAAATVRSTRPSTPTCSRSFRSRRRVSTGAWNRTQRYAATSRNRRRDAQHRELHEPEEPRPDVEADRRTDERPAAAGDHRAQCVWPGREPRRGSEASTSAVLTPRIMASDESSSRCSSTETASTLTSSGTT